MKKFILAFILVLILPFSSNAAYKQSFPCTAYNGGTVGALDYYKVGKLSEGDETHCHVSGDVNHFRFDADSTDAETTAAHPYKIRPDDYATAGVWVEFEPVGTAPGGSNTHVQYNNSGTFGGSSNFVFDGDQVGIGGVVGAGDALKVYGDIRTTIDMHVDGSLDVDGSIITGENWKTYYTNGSGVKTPLALGAASKVLTAQGAAAAPTWQTAGMFDNVCYPEAGSADQGATAVANGDGYQTVKDCVDAFGASETGTIVFRHDGGGNTTSYTFKTTETIPIYITTIMEPGAALKDTTDNSSLTFDGPFIADRGYYLDWGVVGRGTGKVYFGTTIENAGRTPVVYPEWFGAEATGDALDSAPSFNAAISSLRYGGIVEMGLGVYHIHSTVTLNDGIVLRGQGWSVDARSADRDPDGLEAGTWFWIDATGFNAITVAGRGCRIEDIGMAWLQPAVEAGWAPTEYGWGIKITGKLNKLKNLMLLNTTYGISAGTIGGAAVGQIDMDGIFGQAFKTGISLDYITDFSRIRNIHFVHFWAGDQASDYSRNNAHVIRCNKVDGLQIHNVGTFYHKVAISINTTVDGTVGAGVISDVHCNYGAVAFWILGTCDGSYGVLNNVHAVMGHGDAVYYDGSYGFLDQGDNSYWQISNFMSSNTSWQGIGIGGTGNFHKFENIDINGFNKGNNAITGISVGAGNTLYLGSQRRLINPGFGAANIGGAGTIIKDGEGLGEWGTEASENTKAVGTHNYIANMTHDGFVCAYIEPSDGGYSFLEFYDPNATARVKTAAHYNSTAGDNTRVAYGGACIPTKKGNTADSAGMYVRLRVIAGTCDIDVFNIYAQHWPHPYN